MWKWCSRKLLAASSPSRACHITTSLPVPCSRTGSHHRWFHSIHRANCLGPYREERPHSTSTTMASPMLFWHGSCACSGYGCPLTLTMNSQAVLMPLTLGTHGRAPQCLAWPSHNSCMTTPLMEHGCWGCLALLLPFLHTYEGHCTGIVTAASPSASTLVVQ